MAGNAFPLAINYAMCNSLLPTECVSMRDTICRINRPTKHWYVRIILQTVERGDGNHVLKQGIVQYCIAQLISGYLYQMPTFKTRN